MYILGLSRKAKGRGSYIGARLAKQAGRENCDAMLDQGETFGWGRRIGKAEERELGCGAHKVSGGHEGDSIERVKRRDEYRVRYKKGRKV